MRTLGASAFLVLGLVLPAAAQPEPPAGVPADWQPVPGWRVFVDKGCAGCHPVRGVGEGTVAPDLAGRQASRDLFELGAAMWNHLPRMGGAMRQVPIQRPQLTPLELSSLSAFLVTTQYFEPSGDSAKGSRVLVDKGCGQCHAVGGRGGSAGPPLDGLKRSSSPFLLAAALWNHGSLMAEAENARGIAWVPFRGMEVSDLVAYIVASSQQAGPEPAPVVPGTPEQGERLLSERGCGQCHAVGKGKARPSGVRLASPGHRVRGSEFAGLMWNHGLRTSTVMKKRGLAPPRLTGPEMADLAAYLYTTSYLDVTREGARRGGELVRQKGCLGCHTIYRRGGKTASDLAIDNVVSTPAGQVAAMWNHARLMEIKGHRQATPLPSLSGSEFAAVTAYLAGLGSGPPKAK